MTHSSPLDDKLEPELRKRREMTEREFAGTVQMINRRAEKLGAEAKFNEDWKSLAANGYETAGENLMEAQSTVEIIREEKGRT
jgi:hypothetical protein